MSKGLLFFAFNNAKVDYCKLASFAAQRARKMLDLPVCIITDNPDGIFMGMGDSLIIKRYEEEDNKRRYADYGGDLLNFKNLNRFSAFDSSPFDQTILLDVDYIINTKHLLHAFDSDEAYLIPAKLQHIDGGPVQETFMHIAGIPVHWATTVYFDKSSESERLFNCVAHVRDNWTYYAARYKFPPNLYRNDYAFSIAHHLMSGRNTAPREFPVTFRLAGIDDELLSIGEDSLLFHCKEHNTIFRSSGFDIHIMHKASLLKCLNSAS